MCTGVQPSSSSTPGGYDEKDLTSPQQFITQPPSVPQHSPRPGVPLTPTCKLQTSCFRDKSQTHHYPTHLKYISSSIPPNGELSSHHQLAPPTPKPPAMPTQTSFTCLLCHLPTKQASTEGLSFCIFHNDHELSTLHTSSCINSKGF